MLEKLAQFAKENKFRGKGPLSVALVVTDHARSRGLPLDPETLLTERGGQVLGLGKAKVQSVLAKHGVTRILSEEAGRTSRGSIGNMRQYVAFLNDLHANNQSVDLDAIEGFWVDRVREFFAGKPFALRLDSSLSLRAVVRNLMMQAETRQKDMPGVMFLGTMMQHLVGAKLDLLLGEGAVEHHGSNENDQSPDRTGDFDVEDVSIHVTSSPGEALIRKCVGNLDANRRPLIVTARKGVATADGLADNAGVADRIDIVEFEQFIATNIYELGKFAAAKRQVTVNSLISRYNAIIEECESDPSLKIDVVSGK